ncbi:hypothetical protein FACS189421_10660 [Bacteroidia bacterium]|nr:hypothetical protein FACS189421_10660 [Bacteroidia bacterium]GHT48443.1 hypothetical protein FACS189440_12060 [Bacteroidia bacterium]
MIKKHIPKVLYILLFIGFIELLNILLTTSARRLLRDDLTRNVARMTDGLYSLDFGDLDINLLTGFASLDDITLTLNAARLNELYRVDSLPEYYGSAKIKSVNLEGVNFMFRKWKQKELHFRHIHIVAPQLTLINNTEEIPVQHPKDTVVKMRNKSPYEMIAPYLNVISVSDIKLEKGKLRFCSENKTDTTEVKLENINFDAENFRIDSVSDQRSFYLYSENFKLSIDTTQVSSPGNLYTLNSGKIAVNLKDSLLKIENVALKSKVPQWDFAYKDPKHSDWSDLRVGSIELKNFRLQKLIQEKSLLSDSLLVSGVYFSNYKNQKIPTPPSKVPMIYETVQKFPLPFDIRYVKVSNINILYQEMPKNGSDPGAIRFTQMEGIFDGFTNIVTSHTQMNKLTTSGKLMNEGAIRAELYFPVDSTYDVVHIKGTLGAMNMIALNKIIEPMAPARIKSGFIQGLDFDITGGKERATIDMCLLYTDLSIQILLPAGKDHRTESGILSFLANGILEKNNPDPGKDPRRIRTEHIRDPYHSAFNYLWKIYLAGLTETVGYTKGRQKSVAWVEKEIKMLKKKKAAN